MLTAPAGDGLSHRSTQTHSWWRDAVIYQVYVRSFLDSTGDGIGDLAGVRSGLPYLKKLGVDGIWLSRFHFAEGRGPGGDLPPNNWHAMFGGPAWSRVTEQDGTPGQWYLHMFTPEQPDLNWRNPEVPAHFEEVLRFWLDRGVDGFRIDVAAGLFKHPDLPDSDDPEADARTRDSVNPLAWNQPEVHDVWRRWRTVCEEYTARDGRERLLVGEVSVPTAREHALYVRPDEAAPGVLLRPARRPWDAAAFRGVIDEAARHRRTGSSVTWVLNNHDQVRTVTRYGESGTEGSGLGAARARAAALLMLALPGAAYVYQGEELGLPEVVDLPDEVLTDPIFHRTGSRARIRDGCRVPLPGPGTPRPSGSAPERRRGPGCRSRPGSPSTPPTGRSPTPAPSGTCTGTGSSCGAACRSWARAPCAGWRRRRTSSPSSGATAWCAP
ncbi:alpha-amylase family glycosyl hydrolase [Streptomyces sp. CC228A]|uniref:alpha-amylase family glycosyl hydrolase n=1 Tax=Streptomyces sp. CC228A TaxID=2898186 RepID=UPI001EEBAF23|nr:alpha-amylase family glycosyl hydrolase [Streptomyces sp. CC228A]